MNFEITVMLNEEGQVTIRKSEELTVLGGIGLLELAKKVMLENGDQFETLSEDTDVEPVELIEAEVIESDEDESM